MKKITYALLLLATSFAQASETPKHTFYCGLLDQKPEKQIYLEIADKALESGIAEVTISRMGEVNGNRQWVPIKKGTNAQVQLTWGTYRGLPAITGAEISLGKSGSISMHATGPYSDDAITPGYVRANTMELNIPNGTEATYCTYFYAIRPKPGVSGSN